MKKSILFFVCILITVNIYGQKKIDLRLDTLFGLCYNKLAFYPLNAKNNTGYIDTCIGSKVVYNYFLNSLYLHEEKFSKLKIESDDIYTEFSYFEYCFDSIDDNNRKPYIHPKRIELKDGFDSSRIDKYRCYYSINFYIKLKIPLEVNDIKVKQGLYDYCLSQLTLDDILLIETKRDFLLRKYLKIITK